MTMDMDHPIARAVVAALAYVVAVYLSMRLFPTVPLIFLLVLMLGPVALGAWVKTWTWVWVCPLVVGLVLWLARITGPTPVSVNDSPLVDALVAAGAAFLPAAVGAWFGTKDQRD